jgi:hypothetical protein
VKPSDALKNGRLRPNIVTTMTGAVVTTAE